MPIFRAPSQSLRWLFAELAVVVLGILIAFQVEEWRSERVERRTEEVVLSGILEEFSTNLENLTKAKSTVQNRMVLASKVLAITSPEFNSIEVNDADNLLAELINIRFNFQPAEGTLSYLINSEGLGVLSSDQLREHLVNWPSFASRIDDRQERLRELLRVSMMPYLHARVPVRTLDASANIDMGLDRAESLFPIEIDSVFSDLEFENVVYEIYFADQILFDSLSNAESETRDIISLVEAQI